ncbi:hypothetical protein JOF29_001710 [Kribbella aluminosa]|uniref:Uncharacterized protein n=1 Tax=Kribbella aluminosa TaxID=416017 RepID=A0ABS4UG54_9ACTN|nr:hypothetical protein [Kribbella aluminosa]
MKPWPPSASRNPDSAGRGDLPPGSHHRMPQCDRCVVEYDGQPGGDRRPPQLDRWRRRGLRQKRDHRVDDLRATGSLRVRGDRAGHLDHGLLGEFVQLLGRTLDDDLGQAGPVAQDQEADGGEPSSSVHPAGHRDGLAYC